MICSLESELSISWGKRSKHTQKERWTREREQDIQMLNLKYYFSYTTYTILHTTSIYSAH